MTEPKPSSVMSEQKLKWPCDYCTFENWPSAIKCTMCRAPRSIHSIITETSHKTSFNVDSGSEWDIPRTDSSTSLLICPASSAKPRTPSSSSNETANKWTCQMCTYLNFPRAIHCTLCLSQRPKSTSPTMSPQIPSWSSTSPAPVNLCGEYNDRNRLQTLWTCSNCFYQNWAKLSKCVVCDFPKQQEAAKERLEDEQVLNEQDRGPVSTAEGSGGIGVQKRSPPLGKSDKKMLDFQRVEVAAGAAMSTNEDQEVDFKKLKQIRNRMKRSDWLFLNACTALKSWYLPSEGRKMNSLLKERDNGQGGTILLILTCVGLLCLVMVVVSLIHFIYCLL